MIALDILTDGFFAAVAGIRFGAISDPPLGLGSLSYSDTQESISMNYIMYESGIQNNTCLHIKGLGLVITSVTDGG